MENSIISYKPKGKSDKTDAVFGSTTITYNEASYTYNQVGQIYGGADRLSNKGPKGGNIINYKP